MIKLAVVNFCLSKSTPIIFLNNRVMKRSVVNEVPK